jgi:hypothetical protein
MPVGHYPSFVFSKLSGVDQTWYADDAQLASSMLSSNSLQSFKKMDHITNFPESTKSILLIGIAEDLAAATAVSRTLTLLPPTASGFIARRILVITILEKVEVWAKGVKACHCGRLPTDRSCGAAEVAVSAAAMQFVQRVVEGMVMVSPRSESNY